MENKDDGLVDPSEAMPITNVHQQGVVDAAREYVEAIEAKVGKDIIAWLENKGEKFIALKAALAALPVPPGDDQDE